MHRVAGTEMCFFDRILVFELGKRGTAMDLTVVGLEQRGGVYWELLNYSGPLGFTFNVIRLNRAV